VKLLYKETEDEEIVYAIKNSRLNFTLMPSHEQSFANEASHWAATFNREACSPVRIAL
jgi:hypothetical protein